MGDRRAVGLRPVRSDKKSYGADAMFSVKPSLAARMSERSCRNGEAPGAFSSASIDGPRAEYSVTSSTVAFETRWFQILAKTVNGPSVEVDDQPFYAVQPQDYVVAVTAQQHLVMVRQFRPAVERQTLELPSGCVEMNESPEIAAQRELMEETGYRAPKVELLGRLMPDSEHIEHIMVLLRRTSITRKKSTTGRRDAMRPDTSCGDLAAYFRQRTESGTAFGGAYAGDCQRTPTRGPCVLT